MKTFVAVAVLWFSLAATASAQECRLGEAPNVQVGDSHTYRHVQDGKRSVVTYDVVEVTNDSITTRVTTVAGGFPKTRTDKFDRFWNPVEIGGYTYSPKMLSFVFPLEKGKPVPHSMTSHGPDLTNYRVRETLEVIGCEKIEVAGKIYNAIKVRIQGSYSASGSGTDQWSGSRERFLWLDPEVQRFVKSTYRATSPTGGEKSEMELLGFRLVQREVGATGN